MISLETRCPSVLAAFAIATVLGACRSGDPEATSALRLCGSDAAQDIPRLTLMREWSVGGAEARELSLSILGSVSPAPRGGLSFGQRAAAHVLTLDADGAVRSRIGRVGAGPGEWSPVGGLQVAWYGDTLVATESLARRVHRFLESGQLVETRSVTTSDESPGQVLRVLRDGSVLGYTRSQMEPDVRVLRRWLVDEARWDSLSNTGRQTYRLRLGPGGRFASRLMPIRRGPLWAPSPAGRSVVIVDRDAAATPDSSEYRFRRVDVDGGVTSLDRAVCYWPLAFTTEEREDTVQAQLHRVIEAHRPGRSASSVEQAIRDSIFLPEFFPPVTSVVVGTQGDIWLRREVLEDGFAYWEIRNPEGDLKGMLRLPAQRRIRAVDGDVVWVVEPDPWDVPIISRTRLVRR